MNLSNGDEFVFLPHEKELVGRVVKNAFGQEEVVYAESCHWRYLDWLAEHEGVDIEGFLQDCDMARGDWSFSDAIQWWAYWAYEYREEQGKPRPEWLPPIEND